MTPGYPSSVKDRLLRYVTIDTQSDPHSGTCPSTPGQRILGQLLVKELAELGIADASLDAYGYVYATIPATIAEKVPVVCFCAHMDTAPDCSGKDVKPMVHEHYDGSDIHLPEDAAQVITVAAHPYLRKRIGDTIITASGNTLLGADNKSGIAVIMDLVQYLRAHPDLRHGTIKILFTPDEEIGRGVDKVDLQRLGADVAYTLDGGERGALEDENFSADGVTVTIYGVSAHPGSAKDKLVNALKVSARFLDLLPGDELSPEATEGRYGFVHPVEISGIAEKVTLQFIIRDFHTHKLAAYESYLRDKLDIALEQFPGARATFIVKEQYRNMKEVLDHHPLVVSHAIRAMEMAGCEVSREGIRGGTDGARLSHMGLPCPNIFTGEMALHGKQEYVSVQDMEKSREVLVNLVQLWAS